MRPRPLVPCLWFDDTAQEAAAFYARLFPRGRVLGTSHFPSTGANPSGKKPGSVLTVEFEVLGQRFTALNGGPMFQVNPSVSFFVHEPSPAAARQHFTALARGGKVLMPLGRYAWSHCYAWVEDRFGVSWQLMTGRREKGGARVVPCVMFSGAQHGQAAKAIQRWVRAFPDSRVTSLEKYAAGEGPKGMLKHGRFVLGGQELVAMDSHVDAGVGFSEGLSLQVMCADQRELNSVWAKLSRGGKPGPCGWLTDAHGFSWQVVPEQTPAWMTSKDTAARDRAFAAIMTMGRLDIAAIEKAFRGEGTPAPRSARKGPRRAAARRG